MQTWIKATIAAAGLAAVGGWYLFGAHLERPEAVVVKSVHVSDQAITLEGDLANSSRIYRRYRLLPDGGRVYVKLYTALIPPWPSSQTGAFFVEIPFGQSVSQVYLQGPGTSRLIWQRP